MNRTADPRVIPLFQLATYFWLRRDELPQNEARPTGPDAETAAAR